MKTLRFFLLPIVVILLISLNSRIAYAGSCGILPIKPIPPIGCKDLRPECVCDADGNNCHWDWVCIPN
jgi:hypothetical protein